MPVFKAFTNSSRCATGTLHRFAALHFQPPRYFSRTLARSHTYLVWAPDYPEDGVLPRRMAVRPKHFVRANQQIEQGILSEYRLSTQQVAGGLITPESQNATLTDKKFVGSMMLYEAGSIEEVRKLVEQDLYWTENVWDKERLRILPILMATTLSDTVEATQPVPKDP